MSTLSKTRKNLDVPLDEAYFVWLYSQVGSVHNRNRAATYWSLLRYLFRKEFVWSRRVPMDENRAKDGKDLRLDFLRETDADVDEQEFLAEGCSMLELLIALSGALAFETGGQRDEWFWKLLDNLGLLECTDANPANEDILDEILDKVIDRKYAPNGAGGLFPLDNPTKDQRKVELWYQAQAYLLERL